MMDAFELFGLLINDRVVKTPVAVASMAGIVDAEYVLERSSISGSHLSADTLLMKRPWRPRRVSRPGGIAQ